MGCFLGCFGFSSKRNRRKQGVGVLSGCHLRSLCSYESLKTTSENLENLEEKTIVSSTCEPRNVVRKKKVRFNLNVQTYEPIPNEEYKDQAEEIDVEEEICNEISEECGSSSLSKEDLIVPNMGSFPSNHRYRNCIDNYDEEDEIAYHENHLDEEEDDADDDSDKDDDEYAIEEHVEEFSIYQVVDAKSSVPPGSYDEELKQPGIKQQSRNRRQHVHSVLKPVQNATQWKAMKARGITPPMKRQRKENIPSDEQTERHLSSVPTSAKSLPPTQGFAVDASLSNWLVFSDYNHPKTAKFTKDSLFA